MEQSDRWAKRAVRGTSRSALIMALLVLGAWSAAAGSAHAQEEFIGGCGQTSWYQIGSFWRGFRSCPTGRGLAPVTGVFTNTQYKRIALDSAVTGSPVAAADGTIYVGTSNGTVYAVNRYGMVMWRTSVGARVRGAGAIGADGTVYIASDTGKLYALEEWSGRLKWSSAGRGYSVYGSPIIGGDGTVYYADYGSSTTSTGGRLWAINPSDGSVRWFVDKPGKIVATPAISQNGATIYMNDSLRELGAYTTAAGALTWFRGGAFDPFFEADIADAASVAVDGDGTLYVASTSGYVRALHPSDGRTLWSWNAGSPILASPIFTFTPGYVVVATAGGTVSMLRTPVASTRLVFSRAVGGRIVGTPMTAYNGDIHVGSGGAFNFPTSIGNVGGIAAGTAAFHVVTSAGVLRDAATTGNTWFDTVGGVSSSPGMLPLNQAVVGDDAGYLYIIGPRSTGSEDRPTSPEDDVLIRTPVNHLGCASNPSSCTYTGELGPGGTPVPATVIVPTNTSGVTSCIDHNNRFTLNKTAVTFTCNTSPCPATVERASNVVLRSVASNGDCGGHLCDYNPDDAADAASFTQTPIGAAKETPLFTAPSDTSSTNTAFPSVTSPSVVAGCSALTGALAPPATCPINPSTVVTNASCTLDSECVTRHGSDFRCANICLSSAGTVIQEADVPCTNPVLRCGRILESSAASCSAGALPAVSSSVPTPSSSSPPTRLTDYSNYRCHEVRECAEDGALLADATPVCYGPGFVQLASCDTQQQPAPWLNPTAPLAYSEQEIIDPPKSCTFAQPGSFTGHRDAMTMSGKDSQTKPNQRNNWGVTFMPAMWGNADLTPKPMGRFDPTVSAGVSWLAQGRAFGQSIEIFNIGADATLKLCEQNVGTTAKLFGQNISVMGQPQQVLQTTAAQKMNCERAVITAQWGLDRIKRALARAQQIHTVIAQRGLSPNYAKTTLEICRNAPRDWNEDGTHDFDPLRCTTNAPAAGDVTAWRTLHRDVVNAYIRSYGYLYGRLQTYLQNERDTIASALAGPSFSNGGLAGRVNMLNVPVRFGARLVDAKIPIGPFALVLVIEGGGDWGVNGGLTYDLQFFQVSNPTKTPGAHAGAYVEPYAGLSVMLYMGVGVTLGGVAGADVGVGGTVNLINIRTPFEATGGIDSVPAATTPPRPPLANWGGSGGPFALAMDIPRYQWAMSGSMKAGARLTILSGEIDLRLRVYFLFISKTWKKKIAKLAGWSRPSAAAPATYPIVEAAGGVPLMSLPNPLEAAPELSFPIIPTITTSAFPNDINSVGFAVPAANNPLTRVNALVTYPCPVLGG